MFSLKARWDVLTQRIKGHCRERGSHPPECVDIIAYPHFVSPGSISWPSFCFSSVCQDGCAWAHLAADFWPYNICTPVFCPPEHSQETECLREALLTSRSRLQELEVERERQKVERQQLLEDLKEKQQEILHFEEERLSLQEKDSRLEGAH